MSLEVLKELQKEFETRKTVLNEKKFIAIYTYDAVSMEGHNKIPFEYVEKIIEHGTIDGYSDKDQTEILNHVEAFYFIKKLAASDKEFNSEILKDLHEVLSSNVFPGGSYRNVNIQIFGAKHQPPDCMKVYDRMSKYFNVLSNFEGSTLDLAIYAHAQLSKIHPFLDGNGRIARLVMNYFLIKNGYLPISIPVSRRNEYFEALEVFKVEKDSAKLKEFIVLLLIERYNGVLGK
jgi:Fic family protein